MRTSSRSTTGLSRKSLGCSTRDVARRAARGDRDVLEASAIACHPVVREIIAKGARFTAVDGSKRKYAWLGASRRSVTTRGRHGPARRPTAGTIYRVDECSPALRAQREPGLLHEISSIARPRAIAVPGTFAKTSALRHHADRAAFGEAALAHWAHVFTARLATARATSFPLPAARPQTAANESTGGHAGVVGANLSGMPSITSSRFPWRTAARRVLDPRATALCAAGHAAAQTRARARRQRLGRARGSRGVEHSAEEFGSFVAEVPPPLAIGTVSSPTAGRSRASSARVTRSKRARHLRVRGWRRYVMEGR